MTDRTCSEHELCCMHLFSHDDCFAERAYYNFDNALLAGKRVATQLRQARLTRAATVVLPHISVVPSGSEVQ